jgi:hypothetical protein
MYLLWLMFCNLCYWSLLLTYLTWAPLFPIGGCVWFVIRTLCRAKHSIIESTKLPYSMLVPVAISHHNGISPDGCGDIMQNVASELF